VIILIGDVMGRIMPIRTVASPEGWVGADGAAAPINQNFKKRMTL
jgi:hypothetical protein